jgi:hypothetical protein
MDPVTQFMLANDQNYWAACAAIAAWVCGFAGLAINIAGILLVRRQLRENRIALNAAVLSAKSAEESAQLAFQTSRPWVQLNINEVQMGTQHEGYIHIYLAVDYKNIGETPAVQTGLIFKVVPVHPWEKAILTEEYQNFIDEPPWKPKALFPGESHTQALSKGFHYLDPRQYQECYVLIAVVYKSKADGPRHVTPIVIRLHRMEMEEDGGYLSLGKPMAVAAYHTIEEFTPDPT